MANKNNKQTKYKAKGKKSRNLGKKKTSIVRWSLLVLLQVLPPAQESGEGIPTDKVEQQGNETTLGGGGGKRYYNE